MPLYLLELFGPAVKHGFRDAAMSCNMTSAAQNDLNTPRVWNRIAMKPQPFSGELLCELFCELHCELRCGLPPPFQQ